MSLRGKPSHYSILALTELVELYAIQSKYSDASIIRHELVDISESTVGVRSVQRQCRILERAELYEEQGRWIEAGILENQVVDVLQTVLGPDDETILVAKKSFVERSRNRLNLMKQ